MLTTTNQCTECGGNGFAPYDPVDPMMMLSQCDHCGGNGEKPSAVIWWIIPAALLGWIGVIGLVAHIMLGIYHGN